MTSQKNNTSIATSDSAAPSSVQTSLFDVLDAVSHDLKSPVASILSVISLVKMKKDTLTPAELGEYLERAEEKAQFLNENIDALFAVGALLEDRLELQPVPVSVAEIFTRLQYSLKEITFPVVDSSVRVQADEEWLHKALVSLFQHAARCTDEQSETRLTVNGLKTAIELQLEYSGREFFDGSNTTADPFELTFFLTKISKELRLSLYVAVTIIRKHGGEVRLESSGDTQQKLLLTLPAASK